MVWFCKCLILCRAGILLYANKASLSAVATASEVTVTLSSIFD